MTISGSNGRLVQHRATRRDGWTKARRLVFLDELEASCNIRRAAAAAGMTDGTARALRRRDPAFAAAWEAALDAGYDRIEIELLARALAGTGDGETPERAVGEAAPPPMDDHTRITLLKMRDGLRRRDANRPMAVASEAEVEQALLRRLDALDRGRKRES